jgi:hypothetical protein
VKDGLPQVTPVWVDIDNDNKHLIVNTAEGRVNQKMFHETCARSTFSCRQR